MIYRVCSLEQAFAVSNPGERNRPRETTRGGERGDRHTIDKSKSSYAINRPGAADCTSFSYLWPLCRDATGALEACEGTAEKGGGPTAVAEARKGHQLFLCIDMNINNRGSATRGQARHRTQSAWQSSLLATLIYELYLLHSTPHISIRRL